MDEHLKDGDRSVPCIHSFDQVSKRTVSFQSYYEEVTKTYVDALTIYPGQFEVKVSSLTT